MIRFAPIVAGILCAVPAQAQDWREVSYASDLSNIVYVDAASIDRDKPHPTARLLLVVAGDDLSFVGMDGLNEFDCANNRRRGIEAILYDGSGKETDRISGEADWSEFAPGTLFASVAKIVCSNGALKPESAGSQPPIVAGRARLKALRSKGARP